MYEESVISIFHCLCDEKYPLTKTEISEKTGISVQLCSYWIPRMIKCGILLQDKRKRYYVQNILKSKNLNKYVIPLIEEIAVNLDFSNVSDAEDAIEKCVAIYLLDNITSEE